MDILTIILIAISLSVDCFVISLCISCSRKLKSNYYVKIPLLFGFFQFIMTFLGYYLGISFFKYIDGFGHILAFILLLIIGIKMIVESIKNDCKLFNNLSFKILLALSIATSIDAFVVGVALSLINGNILFESLIIGLFSFILPLIGLFLGDKLKRLKIKYIGIIGGIILIIIGLRALL